MRVTLCRVLLVLTLASGTAIAAERSYMSLIGELIGMVEGARMVRDVCAVRSPSTAAANSRLLDSWKTRHKPVLDAAASQISSANDRMKKQGAPGENPVKDMLTAGQGLLEKHLAGMTPAQVREYCGAYPDLIDLKDREATTSIPEILKLLSDADRAPTERE
jgi:hypothetical protein